MKARQKARKVEESRGKTAVETTTETTAKTTGIIGETIGGTDKRPVKSPVESPVESPCGHRRRIAMHGPAGLTMRCECCGAVLTRSMLTNANTGRIKNQRIQSGSRLN